jgi:hypothetical protein
VFDNLHEFDLSSIYPELHEKISAENLVNFLLGHTPEKIAYDDSLAYLSNTSNQLLLIFFNKSAEKKGVLWLDPGNYRIEKAQVNLDGISTTSQFNDFKRIDSDLFFPKKLELRFNDSVISVKYDDDVKVNSSIDKNLFRPWNL